MYDTTPPLSRFEHVPALMSLMAGDEKHEPAAHSTLDVLWVLYDRILRIDPARPDDPDRDRFVLSKGHGPMGYYAVLAAKGFIDPAVLPGFGGFESPLGAHPDRVLVPGVEVGSGSLGHGLPIAVGMALGLRIAGRRQSRVFCLLGDGELDEGSNHEAIALAGRLELGSITAVVVDNDSSTLGWPGGVERRFTVEGWSAMVADGRDHAALEEALGQHVADRPTLVVAGAERKR
jgi:transketolase